MKKVLFIGFPGSGKGTQAQILEKKGFVHISTGKIIRNSKDPEIVSYRNKDYVEGKLLSDKLIFRVVQEEIDKLDSKINGFVLDGAVRTLPQAKQIKEKNLIEVVIFFELGKKISERRLLNRNEGRVDDNPNSIKTRFEEFKKKTKPALNYLKKNFEFHTINAENSSEKIHKEVCKILFK